MKCDLDQLVARDKNSYNHRQEYMYVIVNKDQPHNLHDVEEGSNNCRNEARVEEDSIIHVHEGLEIEVHPTQWALRRVPPTSRVKCNYWALGKKYDALACVGEVAPSFWSDCQLSQWKKEKF